MDHEYGSRLLALCAQTHAHAFAAAREVAQILEVSGHQIVLKTQLITFSHGQQVIQSGMVGAEWTDAKSLE